MIAFMGVQTEPLHVNQFQQDKRILLERIKKMSLAGLESAIDRVITFGIVRVVKSACASVATEFDWSSTKFWRRRNV